MEQVITDKGVINCTRSPSATIRVSNRSPASRTYSVNFSRRGMFVPRTNDRQFTLTSGSEHTISIKPVARDKSLGIGDCTMYIKMASGEKELSRKEIRCIHPHGAKSVSGSATDGIGAPFRSTEEKYKENQFVADFLFKNTAFYFLVFICLSGLGASIFLRPLLFTTCGFVAGVLFQKAFCPLANVKTVRHTESAANIIQAVTAYRQELESEKKRD